MAARLDLHTDDVPLRAFGVTQRRLRGVRYDLLRRLHRDCSPSAKAECCLAIAITELHGDLSVRDSALRKALSLAEDDAVVIKPQRKRQIVVASACVGGERAIQRALKFVLENREELSECYPLLIALAIRSSHDPMELTRQLWQAYWGALESAQRLRQNT